MCIHYVHSGTFSWSTFLHGAVYEGRNFVPSTRTNLLIRNHIQRFQSEAPNSMNFSQTETDRTPRQFGLFRVSNDGELEHHTSIGTSSRGSGDQTAVNVLHQSSHQSVASSPLLDE